jgi:hypothetical protein
MTDSPDQSKSTRRLYLLMSLYLPAVALGLGMGIATPVLPVLARPT